MAIEKELPERRKKGLVVQELSDEVLVYDLERHKAHCLNHTAAMIWKRCDGKTSIAEIARMMKYEMNGVIDEEVIWEAVSQLSRNNLLVERISKPTGMTRREVIRKIGITAAVALPAVISIVAPSAVQAQSCRTLLQSCSPSQQCCPGLICMQLPVVGCRCDVVGPTCSG